MRLAAIARLPLQIPMIVLANRVAPRVLTAHAADSASRAVSCSALESSGATVLPERT